MAPYAIKAGEGLASKIGENLWDGIKQLFSKKGQTPPPLPVDETSRLQFEDILKYHISNNPDFANELNELLAKVSKDINSKQDIHNFGSVEKQVNIQENSGTMTFNL